MGELAQTPEAARLKAQATLKAREDGIRAAAIKQGRTLERAEIMQALGVQRVEEASQINRLIAERDARPTLSEEQKHGRHQRWLGFAVGVPAGMMLACLAIFMMQGIIWDTATRSFREQAMTGAIISSQGEGDGGSEGYTNPGQDVTRRP